MSKLDEVKARLDWLKEQFKILITIMAADIAGLSKLYLDAQIGTLFYLGIVLLIASTVASAIVIRKIEIYLIELREV